MIDASSSMTYSSAKVSKLEYAKFLAAAMSYLILNQRDSVGLSILTQKCVISSPSFCAECNSSDRKEPSRNQASPENRDL